MDMEKKNKKSGSLIAQRKKSSTADMKLNSAEWFREFSISRELTHAPMLDLLAGQFSNYRSEALSSHLNLA